MKTALYTLVAAVALTLGGAFTSQALAAPGHHGQSHHGHNHGHNHGHQHLHGGNHGHQHFGHQHFHGGYGYRPVSPYYYRPVYPQYYRQNGIYFGGSNFGIRLGW